MHYRAGPAEHCCGCCIVGAGGVGLPIPYGLSEHLAELLREGYTWTATHRHLFCFLSFPAGNESFVKKEADETGRIP